MYALHGVPGFFLVSRRFQTPQRSSVESTVFMVKAVLGIRSQDPPFFWKPFSKRFTLVSCAMSTSDKNNDRQCEDCGKYEAVEIGDSLLCPDCLQLRGACCAGDDA